MGKTAEELREEDIKYETEKKQTIEEMNKVARFYNEDFNRLILTDTGKSLNGWDLDYDLWYIHILGDTDEELKRNVMTVAKGLQYFCDVPNWAYWDLENETNWQWYKYLYRKDDLEGLNYDSFKPKKYYKSCKKDLDNALENYIDEVNRGKKMEEIFKK